MGLDKAYKDIFKPQNLHENLNRINGEYKDNELVSEVIRFIEKDKKTNLGTTKLIYDCLYFWRNRFSKIYL